MLGVEVQDSVCDVIHLKEGESISDISTTGPSIPLLVIEPPVLWPLCKGGCGRGSCHSRSDVQMGYRAMLKGSQMCARVCTVPLPLPFAGTVTAKCVWGAGLCAHRGWVPAVNIHIVKVSL